MEVQEQEMVPVQTTEETIPEPKKTCCQRLLGKMGAGSLSGCIFNMCILSLGTGCLSLPQKVGYLSLVFTPIAVAIAGAANIWTLLCLSSISCKYNINNYSELVKHLYGKALGVFLDVVIIIYAFGILILYQVILYKLIGGVVNEIGSYGYESLDDFLKNSFWKGYKWKFPVCYGFSVVILLPICLLKNVSKMRFTSAFGILSLFFLIGIVVVECPWFAVNYHNEIYKKDDSSTHLNIIDVSKGFDKDMSFFKSIATLFYAYSCHLGAFPVINSLENRTKRRINKVFVTAIVIDAISYCIIGISGYLTQPIDTPDLIIERKSIFSNDWVMTVGRILFILTLFTKIPSNYNALRISFLSTIGKDSNDFSNFINVALTVPTLLITTFVCIMYQSVTDYISLIGSFCTVVMSFLIPGLIYVKGNDYPRYHYVNIITIIIAGILSLIGFVSGVFTIISIAENN